MDKIRHYIRESYLELTTKVTWPTWPELQASAIVVAVASIIVAALIAGMDEASRVTLTLFYSTFKS